MLDMGKMANDSPATLKKSLVLELERQLKAEGLKTAGRHPSDNFVHLIESLCAKHGQRVVVLIDEYDKPILDHIARPEIAESNREVLRGFYGILKSMDQYLSFTFITGVTKFTKTAIFSGLNNLLDITLMKDYANICGIAVDELGSYFSDRINELSTSNGFTDIASVHDEILNWYDGYSWDGESRVINPFSLLNFFRQKMFSGFWYASGAPNFLIDLIKEDPGQFENFRSSKMTEFMLDAADLNKLDPESIMFQAGYLTVKSVDYSMGSPIYHLVMPNLEVREAFNLQIKSHRYSTL
jgi:hypothetical protein